MQKSAAVIAMLHMSNLYYAKLTDELVVEDEDELCAVLSLFLLLLLSRSLFLFCLEPKRLSTK